MFITAHSGADGTPDNSLTFVRHALTLPVDAFEIDVHRRADGVLVIAHDSDPAGDYDGCPTLREVFALAAARPALAINCDLKGAGLESAVAALFAVCGGANPLFFSGTVSPAQAPRGVTVLRNAEELVDHFYDRMRAGEEVACAYAVATRCIADGITVANVYYRACTDRFRETLAAHGIGVSVWTVDTPEDALRFQAAGAFNLTTRAPSALLPVLRP